MRIERHTRFWRAVSALLLFFSGLHASCYAADNSYSAVLKRNRMKVYQDAVLKGRVAVDDIGSSNDWGGRDHINESDYTSRLTIGCSGTGRIYVVCDPNQKELVKTNQPESVQVDTSRLPNDPYISLAPVNGEVHLSVRTPELLKIGSSGTLEWFLTAGNLRALAAGGSGENTIHGTGNIDVIKFGSSGRNHLDGASFIVNDVIAGSSGTNTAVVAPRNSLYVGSSGTTHVKSLTRPPFFHKVGEKSYVEFAKN
ncbi:MAG: DUF2807 domain-containing protein [Candidatus Obscuribacterales bacterium]|nr:DUF2807 domain-containing protein [Candidatus Obscuribacterales bacterium]